MALPAHTDSLFPPDPDGIDAESSAPPSMAGGSRTPRSPVGLAPIDPRLAGMAGDLPRRIRLGTSSWSFPGWRGLVWDRESTESTLAREGLRAYASHPLLRCVGIDKTYYRPPSVKDLAAMAAQVPDDFRFLMKAPESLVSRRPMHGESRFLEVAFAIDAVIAPFAEGLGSKGGPLLFQFPPIGLRRSAAASEFIAEVAAFLTQLPRGPLYAIEVRDRLVLTPAWIEALRAGGAVHCYSVHPSMPSPLEQARACPPQPGAPLVCRWMLHGGQTYDDAVSRYEPFDRLVDPDPRSRDEFAAMLERAAGQERDCFLIANNKAEGSSPITLALLAEAILARGDHSRPTLR